MTAAARLTVFFFNYTATTEIYTLSLHDALPIFLRLAVLALGTIGVARVVESLPHIGGTRAERFFADDQRALVETLRLCVLALVDRRSTRLNSSHSQMSCAVFCLKKTATPAPMAA